MAPAVGTLREPTQINRSYVIFFKKPLKMSAKRASADGGCELPVLRYFLYVPVLGMEHGTYEYIIYFVSPVM